MSSSSSTPPAADEDVQQGKGRPTPSRREREAANKRPLVPNDRKEANKRAREHERERRERVRIGMANGEERYLPERDKGPQRRWLRDYVDARFSVGELLIPMMVLVIILSLVPSAEIQYAAILVLWLFFIAAIVDVVIAGQLAVRRLRAKFGETQVQRGTRWYVAMRALQMRPLRLPKPQVKRGAKPQ